MIGAMLLWCMGGDVQQKRSFWQGHSFFNPVQVCKAAVEEVVVRTKPWIVPAVKSVACATAAYWAYSCMQMHDDHAQDGGQALVPSLSDYAVTLAAHALSKNTIMTMASCLLWQFTQVGTTSCVANPVQDQFVEKKTAYQSPLLDVGSNARILRVREKGKLVLPSWLSLTSNFPIFQIPDVGRGVAISNDIAYVAANKYGLYAINISNPQNLTLLDRLDTNGEAHGVTISGNIAYVAAWDVGLHTIDISNPRNLTLLDTYNTPGKAYSVVVNSNTAYVADEGFGLSIIRVSNLGKLNLSGTYNVPGMYVISVAVVGNVAYVSDYNLGLHIINISTSPPSFLGQYANTSAKMRGIFVSNNVAYAGSDNGFYTININNPQNLSLLGIYRTPGLVHSVALTGTVAFVANDVFGMHAIDVSDPKNMLLLSTYGVSGSVYGISATGKIVYLSGEGSGFQIINITQGMLIGIPSLDQKTTLEIVGNNCLYNFSLTTDGSPIRTTIPLVDLSVFPQGNVKQNVHTLFTDVDQPVLVYSAKLRNGQSLPSWLKFTYEPLLIGTATAASARSVSIFGNFAYIACENFGLRIIDISDPRKPNLSISYNGTGGIYSVVVADNIAYVTNKQLYTIDISNPQKPSLLDNHDMSAEAYGVAIANNIVYVANVYTGLYAINVSDPKKLNRLGNYPNMQIYDVSISDNLAYVADRYSGLYILNVSNPQNMVRLGNYNTPDESYYVTVFKGIAYITDIKFGLYAIDISNPQNLTLLGSCDTPGEARSVVISDNNLAYVADGSGGLQIINVGNLTSMALLGRLKTSGVIFDVAIDGKIVYAADYKDGLLAIDVSPFTLVGQPFAADIGNYQINITATDVLGGSVSDILPIRVEGPPVLNGTIGQQWGKVGRAFNYFIPQGVFSDPNLDPLVYSAKLANGSQLPDWLSFNPASATFAGTPPEMKNQTFIINVEARDNVIQPNGLPGSVATNFSVYIDHLPQLSQQMPNQVADIGKPFTFSLNKTTFTDQDGDVLAYRASKIDGTPLPGWLSFENLMQLFSGTPSVNDTGLQVLQVTATDPYGGEAVGQFDLVIENFPQLNNRIPNQVMGTGRSFSYTIPPDTFFDADQEVLIYQLTKKPDWVQFDPATRQILGTAPMVTGNYTFEITATDPKGGSSVSGFTAEVVGIPEINPNRVIILPTNFRENKPFVYAIPSDVFKPDILRYNLTLDGNTLPSWLTFDAKNFTVNSVSPVKGEWNLQLTATNQKGISTTTQTFLLTIDQNLPPKLAVSIQNQLAGVGKLFNFSIDPKTFSDPYPDVVLTYKGSRSGGGELPTWLSFTNNMFLGTPKTVDQGILPLQVVAKDPYGGEVVAQFNLVVDYFPVVTVNLPDHVVAGVGRGFSYTIPSDAFFDADQEMLTYQLMKKPDWVQFDPAARQLTGIPVVKGNYTVEVMATDPKGGNCLAQFAIEVADAPVLNLDQDIKVPSHIKEGRSFRMYLPSDMFKDSGSLNYKVLPFEGDMPQWVAFDPGNLTLSGIPPFGSRGTRSLQFVGINGKNISTSKIFTITIEENFVPTSSKITNIPDATVGAPYKHILEMANIFKDRNEDELKYKTQELPDWLHVQESIDKQNSVFFEFSGNPTRDAMYFYADKLSSVTLVAEDDQNASVSETFYIKVTGESYGKLLLKIVLGLGGPASTLYAVYKKYPMLKNLWNKHRGNYQRPDITMDLSEPFNEIPLEKLREDVKLVQIVAPRPDWYKFWQDEQIIFDNEMFECDSAKQLTLKNLNSDMGSNRSGLSSLILEVKDSKNRVIERRKVDFPIKEQGLDRIPGDNVGIIQAFKEAEPLPKWYQVWADRLITLQGGALLPHWLEYNIHTKKLERKGDKPIEEGSYVMQFRQDNGVIVDEFKLIMKKKIAPLDKSAVKASETSPTNGLGQSAQNPFLSHKSQERKRRQKDTVISQSESHPPQTLNTPSDTMENSEQV